MAINVKSKKCFAVALITCVSSTVWYDYIRVNFTRTISLVEYTPYILAFLGLQSMSCDTCIADNVTHAPSHFAWSQQLKRWILIYYIYPASNMTNIALPANCIYGRLTPISKLQSRNSGLWSFLRRHSQSLERVSLSPSTSQTPFCYFVFWIFCFVR